MKEACSPKKGKQVYSSSKPKGMVKKTDNGFYGHLDPLAIKAKHTIIKHTSNTQF